jgi:hypothetical protein
MVFRDTHTKKCCYAKNIKNFKEKWKVCNYNYKDAKIFTSALIQLHQSVKKLLSFM